MVVACSTVMRQRGYRSKELMQYVVFVGENNDDV